MSETGLGPAAHAGRRGPRQLPTQGPRPYPALPADADPRDIAMSAMRALMRAKDRDAVRHVLATAVHDLGGALVPARLEPQHALPVDVSLGVGDPIVVVVDPLSVGAMRLNTFLPALVDDARVALDHIRTAIPTMRGSRSVPDDVPERYRRAVGSADLPTAQAVIRRAVRDGVAPSALVEGVFVPVQLDAGERWYRGEWSIADEHAATAVTDACLPLVPTSDEGPHVVLACPAGEWHTTPARLAAVAADGVRVTVLGPGLPADSLRRYLELAAPDALAVSCTMATNLLAAAEAVQSAHAVGIPVVVGGRAFGRDERRAVRLGADAWLERPNELAQVVAGLEPGPDVDVPHEALVVDNVADDVLLVALDRLTASSQWAGAMNDRQRRATLDDLRWIARHAAAALVSRDERVLDELLTWLAVLLDARGVPRTALLDSAHYLADALEPEAPTAAAVVERCVARIA